MTSTTTRLARRLVGAHEAGIALVLLALCVFLSLASPHFLTTENLAIVARQVSLIAVVAIGMTLVILLGGIDLSVGSVVALASVVVGYATVRLRLPIAAGILAALLAGALVGAVNGWLVVATRVPSFIVTLGMMGVARGAALVVTKGSTISGLPGEYLVLGQGYWLGVPLPVWFATALAIAAHVFLTRTTLGREIYFIGSNEEAARLSGIRVDRVKLVVFVLCSTLAALEAVVETARMSTAQPAAGIGYELSAIGSVIIGGASLLGGAGTVLGTILGAALLGVMTNGLILLGVSAYWQQVFSGAIIVLAVTLDTWRRQRG